MRRALVPLVAALSACGAPPTQPAPAVAGESEHIDLTLYRDGDTRAAREQRMVLRPDGNTTTLEPRIFTPPVALVVESTQVTLSQGRTRVALERLPDEAAPASLWIQSRTDPSRVSVESYTPRRSPATSLLGLPIRVVQHATTIEGTVVRAVDARLTVRTRSGSTWLISPAVGMLATSIPSDWSSPQVRLEVGTAGRHLLELGYTTTAIDWRIDYLARVSSGSGGAAPPVAGPVTASLGALLTINNRAGVAYPRARVVVYSGTLSSTASHPIRVWRGELSLPERGEVSVPLEFDIAAARIVYQYRGQLEDESGDEKQPGWGQASSQEVTSTLELTPRDGVTLPMGAVLVEVATPGRPPVMVSTFLGHRVIGPATARARIGSAPELRGRRRQTGTRRSRSGDELVESIEIELTNVGSKPATVEVVERLNRSRRFEIQPSGRRALPSVQVGDELRVTLEVPARGSKSMRYTVRYSL